MRKVNLPVTQVSTQYTKFGGGIDMTTPVMAISPGCALSALNYEPGLNGGYKRIDGFERFDGRARPSAATYTYLQADSIGNIAIGQTVTGATSGATGIAIFLDVQYKGVCVSKMTGQFVSGEAIMVAGVVKGYLNTTPSPRGCRDAYGDSVALAAAADLYRANIAIVPGSGPVRGVWMHKGVLYAFRDNSAGTACVMFRATSSGWSAITLGEEINFSNAGEALAEGATLTQGGVTATIKRVVLQTGALAGGVNTGRLILASRAGGSFANGAATAGAVGLTLTTSQASIALNPGGRYEFVSSNFGGATDTYRMYGCSGVHRAFEFDGTTFVPINTGMVNDKPAFITVHKKKLFLAFRSSVQYSGDGTPYQWTILAGANELGMGDDITGMATQAGDTLAIFTRNSSWQLNGNTSASFSLLPISAEVGAVPYTVQTVGKTFALDDRGIVSTDRTQAYGNFIQSTLSNAVQPAIEMLRPRVAGSTVYRNRNQYRIFGTDGSILMMGMGDGGLLGFTQGQYPVKPTCFASCEDGSGNDAVFFGSDEGMVYQADVGSSFDGEAIEASLRMPFNNISSPRYRKRFRKAVMDLNAKGYTTIRFQPEFSFGDPDIGTHRLQSGQTAGTGGYWDVDNWDQFFFDAQLVTAPEFSIEGTGLNLSLLFYTASSIDLGHVLQGMLIHFSLRRLSR